MRKANEQEGMSTASGDDVSPRQQLLKLRLEAARQQQSMRKISPRGNGTGPIPLSCAQERLWFLEQVGLVGTAYNVPLIVRLAGPLQKTALDQAFSELVNRHESLRTTFHVHNGAPYQLIDTTARVDVRQIDLAQLADEHQREEQVRRWTKLEQVYTFNLSVGPLIRAVLIRLHPLEHVLLVTMHHIIADGWSIGVMVRELSTMYAACLREEPHPLARLPVQYADYAIWQRRCLQEGTLESQLRYWKKTLAGSPIQLALPTDRPRPAVETFRGGMHKFELPASLTRSLVQLGQRQGATLFMVILAAFQLLLSRWSGTQDIIVGSPIAGRRDQDVEGLIGFFVNTLVLRAKVSEGQTFLQFLEDIKETTLAAYAHQDLPFETLVKELRPERNLSRQPLFQVMLALQNYSEEQSEVAGLSWRWSIAE